MTHACTAARIGLRAKNGEKDGCVDDVTQCGRAGDNAAAFT